MTSILQRIGHTPLIQLGAVVPEGCARILVKLESENPTGSMKDRMAAFGAQLTVVPSVDGGLDAARQIAESTGGFWTDQLHNADQLTAYRDMGQEIWEQSEGHVNAFVQMTGTGASSRGISEALHAHNPEVHCVAVEPSESAVLSGGNLAAAIEIGRRLGPEHANGIEPAGNREGPRE